MSVVRMIPLGIGEAFTALYYTTCMALGVDDDWILIECPHPIRKMLREGAHAAGLPLDLDRVRGVVLSHLHADHCCGLEDYGYYTYFALGHRARLLTHPEVAKDLWHGLLAAGMGTFHDPRTPGAPPTVRTFDEFFELTTLSETAPVAFGPFTIECRRTLHPIPTTAFRIRAGGRTLGFSADTGYDRTLIDWLSSADLIVHEATTAVHTGVHTPYDRLAVLPAPLRAKMRLIHCPDDFDRAGSVIEPLVQGRCYLV